MTGIKVFFAFLLYICAAGGLFLLIRQVIVVVFLRRIGRTILNPLGLAVVGGLTAMFAYLAIFITSKI